MTIKHKYVLPLLVTCFAVASVPAVWALGKASDVESLAPTAQHAKISRLVTTLFEHSHYRKAKVDDTLSSQILDRYLEALDGNRMYFLASDIQAFEAYRSRIDDMVKTGKIEPLFKIFERYRQRVQERITLAMAQLNEEHDFTVDERYFFDRKGQPWFETAAELDDFWRRRVKNDMVSLTLAEREPEKVTELLTSRYERVLRRTNQLNNDEVFETFMNAYADTLDPHSNYFSPRNAEEYRIQMSLSYEGIGASLQLDDEYVTILDVIPGGPAALAGTLAPKDRIVGVGQAKEDGITDVVGWRLDDVVQLIRGPGGTAVNLLILPAGAAPGSTEKIVTLVRDKIKLEAQAAHKSIEEIQREGHTVKVGVIKVPSFYQNYQAKVDGDKDYTSVTRDVARLIGELEKDGVDALVMDLRGNGGGHLSEATALSGLFIDDGPVVQLRYSRGTIEVHEDTDRGAVYGGPLAVLVDRYSASASEIFAAAIQDYGRGIVVGQRTFGKGSVQNLYPLSRYAPRDEKQDYGQLTLTIGKYYRVTGGSTQHRGVEPDIDLPSGVDASEIGESTRPTALPWDQIRSVRHDTVGSLNPAITSLQTRHQQRVQNDPDFNHLLDDIQISTTYRSRKSLSLNLETRKAERMEIEEKRLVNENHRRAALGLEALKTTAELEDVEPVDVQLTETAQILADAVDSPLLTAVNLKMKQQTTDN